MPFPRLTAVEMQVHQRLSYSTEVEERLMLKASSAEATCRRLASDAMGRSKSICDRVLEAIAALEAKVDSHATDAAPSDIKVGRATWKWAWTVCRCSCTLDPTNF